VGEVAQEVEKKVEAEKERIFKLAESAVEYTLSALKYAMVFDDPLHARISIEYALEYLEAAKIALKGLEELLEKKKEASSKG
jgi:hypothetical protein